MGSVRRALAAVLMKRFLAIGGAALLFVLGLWFLWGNGGDRDDPRRRSGDPRATPDGPALRWSRGDDDREDRGIETRVEAGAVEGRVVDAIDGRPIEGATVTLRSAGGSALDETSSEEDGRFWFAETGEADVVVAAAPGYAIGAKDLGEGEIVLELDGAVKIAGVVVGPGGDPVADAEVWIEDRERAYFQPAVSTTVKADVEGRFVIEDAPSGTLIAHAVHPKFAEARLELGGLGPGRQKEGVRIDMADTGALSGRVVDESGSPVADVRVTWNAEGGDRAAIEGTATGSDGRYRLPHVPAGKALVVAKAATAAGETTTEVVVGADVVADIVVTALAMFTGTVVDSSDRPVEGARVSLGQSDGRRYAGSSQMTDAKGRFSVHARVAKPTLLHAAKEHASGTEKASPGVPVVIRVQALGIARVQVVGADGVPYLGNVRVAVEGGTRAEGRWGKTLRAVNGAATFEGLAGEWRVRAFVGGVEEEDEDRGDDDADGLPPLRAGEVKVTIPAAPPETDITVRVPATMASRTTVRGRIAGSDGVAVAGARVSVLEESRDWRGSSGARLDWSGAVRSDAGGRFAIALPAGSQKLFVYHPEYRSEIATVVVPANGEGDAGVIRLDPGTGASAVYEFSGIGAVLTVDDASRCVIQDVVKGGPAERAGIRAKDIVLEVDGAALHGMALGDVIGRIRGPIGTTVTLRIERAGNLESFLVDVVRDKIRA